MQRLLLIPIGLSALGALADPTADLRKSVLAGDLQQAAASIASGAEPNAADASGTTTLHLAAGRGLDRIVVLLIEHGARVNAQDADGLTALHLAAALRDTSVAQTLLERGAAPNIQTHDGRTALEIAVAANRAETIRLLNRYDAELGRLRGNRNRSGIGR